MISKIPQIGGRTPPHFCLSFFHICLLYYPPTHSPGEEVLVNTRRRLNALLDNLRHLTVFWPKFNRWELYYFLIQHFLLIFRITPKDITVFRLYRSTIWSIFRTQQLQMRKMYCKAPNLLPQWNSLGILDIMHSQLPNNGILKQSHYII